MTSTRCGRHGRFAAAALGIATCLVAATAAPACAGWGVSFETGITFGGYNDVRIPGDTGTDVSFTDDLETDTRPFVRGRITWQLDRHTVTLLAAPLRLDAEGTLDRDVSFNGVEFPGNALVEGRYRFDSWRVTWRYAFHKSDRLEIGAGITAKVRDAGIRLAWGGTVTEKTNVGFVPLVNVRLRWTPDGAAGFLFEADALAAPQGRAEDVLAAILFDLGPRRAFYAGYRLLEGGADNDEVYNFALIHYAVVGVEIGL